MRIVMTRDESSLEQDVSYLSPSATNGALVGCQIWNRLQYRKDPRTGKRISRLNPESEWVITEVSELRIIEQDLWDKVREHQGALVKKRTNGEKRRPVHLLSFLLKCGECGGGMSMISKSRYGCSTARNKGTCKNRLSIDKAKLEGRVLHALRSRLMDADLTREFCREYATHMNALQKDRNAQLHLNQAELATVEAKMKKVMEAVLEGLSVQFAQASLEELQKRKDALTEALGDQEEATVFVHPRMSGRYADAIQNLLGMLNTPDQKTEASKLIRTLVDEIVLTPKALLHKWSDGIHCMNPA